VAVVQRFGGALNLNVHVHALVMDGVFARAGEGVAFVPGPPLADLEVAEVLAPRAAWRTHVVTCAARLDGAPPPAIDVAPAPPGRARFPVPPQGDRVRPARLIA
jgi:hypothetical protein